MSSSRPVRRPTETTALHNTRRPCPPADQVRNLLHAAHATGDRYGARHFAHMLTRSLAQPGGDQ
ncbi:hypothetical protein [Streptomyces parvus]|uniref:hypothetical protein n=1 Tax=Streptomyces parvus TaxID=66428 RepID=UPI00331F9A2F